MSLELKDGYVFLLVDFGTGTAPLKSKKPLEIDVSHSINILVQPEVSSPFFC